MFKKGISFIFGHKKLILRDCHNDDEINFQTQIKCLSTLSLQVIVPNITKTNVTFQIFYLLSSQEI